MYLRMTWATIVLAVLIAGCSVPQTSASDGAEQTPAGAESVDALEVSGPASAATVPDMKPVVDDPKPSLPAEVTDAAGNTVTVSAADRVLALDLYGTLTDTVIGLGMSDRLVGRANSDTQKALSDLPVVTKDGHDLNIEAVMNLSPDVILTNTTIGNPRLYKKLESAGVTVVRFQHKPRLKAIPGTIKQIGKTLGVPDAAGRLAQHTSERMDKAVKQIDDLRAQTPRKPRGMVLYVRGTAGIFFILGADYGAGDVLNALGLEDTAKKHGITSMKPANAESLVSLDPEIVLAMKEGVESAGGIDELLDRPGLSATTAGRNKRLITAADSQLLSYGPRTPDNLLALARAIYAS